jgi:hypothetical protein
VTLPPSLGGKVTSLLYKFCLSTTNFNGLGFEMFTK